MRKNENPLKLFRGAKRVDVAPKEIRDTILKMVSDAVDVINGEIEGNVDNFTAALADEFREKPSMVLTTLEKLGKAIPDTAVVVNVPGSAEPQNFGAVFRDGAEMLEGYSTPETAVDNLEPDMVEDSDSG